MPSPYHNLPMTGPSFRSLFLNQASPKLNPIFNPQLLDSFAAGDIDSPSPDPAIQKSARSLPQHRYDWYLRVLGQPWPSHIPPDFDLNAELSPSTPIPWSQWDVHAPVSSRVLHFSKEEIERIYSHAANPSIGSSKKRTVSKHDALLAHIWSRITIARQHPLNTVTYLDLTFGLRSRVEPPLPDSFLGSPITHAAIPYTISDKETNREDLGEIAQSIRDSLALFTADTVGEILHDMAYEVAPQRLWRACLGKEHLLVTSWVKSRVWEVDFVGGVGPRYVDALMSRCDGLMEIKEGGKVREGAAWIDEGVDITLYLEEGSMDRLLADEELWGSSRV